ncbi:hypothetical protein H4219_002075 [Mycoemilia scoparia]|uniref:Large ribosomal subunit protein bL32m n=1 Tax=Mycoemilia scoparia TaxID=417184 RepID=A0A9W7ZYE9_9FUNG|nr:hypothetical protein H4219_002075 [Mycoemilia scoparia]
MPRLAYAIARNRFQIALASATLRTQAPAIENLSNRISNWWQDVGRIGELLRESILRAAPKQRTSHSKKRMRASNKGLKNKKDIVPCRSCGRSKLSAHICPHCYKDIRTTMKSLTS